MSRLPDTLFMLRARSGLSLDQLAGRTGIASARLAAIESGAVGDPYFAEVAAITAALGGSLDALAGEVSTAGERPRRASALVRESALPCTSRRGPAGVRDGVRPPPRP